jgi:hypothetical protein
VPFIACLNNVKTTHAQQACTAPTHAEPNHRTPDPPHNQGMSRQTLNDRRPQGKQTTAAKFITHSPHTTHQASHPVELRAVKMLASTMQISNNNPTNTRHHPQAAPDKGEHQKHQPPTPHTRRAGTADSSGPNSVLDPTPTNVRHE